jgi:Carboxypeptidase regulatory-like domain
MILTVLLLSFMTTAQQPSPPRANNFGVIKGVVVDQDGKPVAGANVYVGGIRWPAEGHNDPPLNSRSNETTSDANGEFVLDRVIPSKSVMIHAYTDTDYYGFVLWAFNLPPESERPEVEVKPGQTVTGITVRLTQRAGKLRVYVRDAKTGETVNGVFSQLCREDHPTYCAMSSGSETTPVPVGVGISIKIKTDDRRHVKWQYHDPKTGSPYFRAKSGETETMDIYLRKKK